MTPVDFRNGERFAHGTRSRYNAMKCRCAPCRAANTAYESERQKRVASGDARPLISSAGVRAHLLELAAQGVGLRSVSAACDVPRSILWGIRSSRRPNVRADVARRILDVDTSVIADHALVPARASQRLIAELVEEGFPRCQLAAALGSTAKTPALQFTKKRVLAKSAQRIRKLHEKLIGPEGDDAPTIDATPRARILRAIRHFDEIATVDLLDAMDVQHDERNKYTQALLRLVKAGELEVGSERTRYRLARRAEDA